MVLLKVVYSRYPCVIVLRNCVCIYYWWNKRARNLSTMCSLVY